MFTEGEEMYLQGKTFVLQPLKTAYFQKYLDSKNITKTNCSDFIFFNFMK